MYREMAVPNEWVETGETGGLAVMLGEDIAPDEARELQGSMVFLFPGLEVEDVRIFDMPGVLDWIALLHRRIPHLIYFLMPHVSAGALEALLLMMLPPEERRAAGESGVALNEEMLKGLTDRLVQAARFASAKGDDWEPIISRFVEPLGGEAREYFVGLVRDQAGG